MRRPVKEVEPIRYWESDGPPEPLTLLLTRGRVLLRCRPSVLRACGYALHSGRSNVVPR